MGLDIPFGSRSMMYGQGSEGSLQEVVVVSLSMRQCARCGCDNPVKKPTNRYCSRECCITDPERIGRLRESSRRRVLPLARQLDLSIWAGEESGLAAVCFGVEDAPAGLSRLAG
jgi:hypothetical protein